MKSHIIYTLSLFLLLISQSILAAPLIILWDDAGYVPTDIDGTLQQVTKPLTICRDSEDQEESLQLYLSLNCQEMECSLSGTEFNPKQGQMCQTFHITMASTTIQQSHGTLNIQCRENGINCDQSITLSAQFISSNRYSSLKDNQIYPLGNLRIIEEGIDQVQPVIQGTELLLIGHDKARIFDIDPTSKAIHFNRMVPFTSAANSYFCEGSNNRILEITDTRLKTRSDSGVEISASQANLLAFTIKQSSRVRLVGDCKIVSNNAPEVSSGRVEVRRHSNETWGRVCDDDWNWQDADVVCSELGFSGRISSVVANGCGSGTGPIYLDNVRCTGNEPSLLDCPHNEWGNHNCGTEDAGVICKSNDITQPQIIGCPYLNGTQLSLVTGSNQVVFEVKEVNLSSLFTEKGPLTLIFSPASHPNDLPSKIFDWAPLSGNRILRVPKANESTAILDFSQGNRTQHIIETPDNILFSASNTGYYIIERDKNQPKLNYYIGVGNSISETRNLSIDALNVNNAEKIVVSSSKVIIVSHNSSSGQANLALYLHLDAGDTIPFIKERMVITTTIFRTEEATSTVSATPNVREPSASSRATSIHGKGVLNNILERLGL